VSFLRFLLSGEKDVDVFAEANSRHRRRRTDLADMSEARTTLSVPSSGTQAVTDQSESLSPNSDDVELRAGSSSAKSLLSDKPG
jgi:hypothetical protein